jgi:hypothetical protein
LRDIIPCFLDHFHHHGSISDEECDNGLPNGSTGCHSRSGSWHQ